MERQGRGNEHKIANTENNGISSSKIKSRDKDITWTTTMNTCKMLQAFELWCYRNTLPISWMKRVANEKVPSNVGNPIPLDQYTVYSSSKFVSSDM